MYVINMLLHLVIAPFFVMGENFTLCVSSDKHARAYARSYASKYVRFLSTGEFYLFFDYTVRIKRVEKEAETFCGNLMQINIYLRKIKCCQIAWKKRKINTFHLQLGKKWNCQRSYLGRRTSLIGLLIVYEKRHQSWQLIGARVQTFSTRHNKS